MEQEEILRQKAVRLHLQGESAQSVAAKLNKTRQWVYKWIARYEKRSSEDWYKSDSNAPKTRPKRTDAKLESSIVAIRKSLLGQPYSQTGALQILYSLNQMGVTPPSISTINRVIKRNNLINKSGVRVCKETEYPPPFIGTHQMDLVGPRYLKGGCRLYLLDIIDVETHYAWVYPIRNKSAESITPCVTDFWRNYGMPDYLQMDNELSFRGSNRHPRGLGLLMRVAISNGIVPVFIPPREPWRNGVIEKFNDNVQKRFFNSRTFTSFEEVQQEAANFSRFHNEHHLYKAQGNQTPNQAVSKHLPCIKLEKDIDLTSPVYLEEGKLIFIRFIRSDQKLHLLNSEFMVKPELVYSYVVAEIVLEERVVFVSQNNYTHHIFDFPMTLP